MAPAEEPTVPEARHEREVEVVLCYNCGDIMQRAYVFQTKLILCSL